MFVDTNPVQAGLSLRGWEVGWEGEIVFVEHNPVQAGLSLEGREGGRKGGRGEISVC